MIPACASFASASPAVTISNRCARVNWASTCNIDCGFPARRTTLFSRSRPCGASSPTPKAFRDWSTRSAINVCSTVLCNRPPALTSGWWAGRFANWKEKYTHELDQRCPQTRQQVASPAAGGSRRRVPSGGTTAPITRDCSSDLPDCSDHFWIGRLVPLSRLAGEPSGGRKRRYNHGGRQRKCRGKAARLAGDESKRDRQRFDERSCGRPRAKPAGPAAVQVECDLLSRQESVGRHQLQEPLRRGQGGAGEGARDRTGECNARKGRPDQCVDPGVSRGYTFADFAAPISARG